ncbi:hypothetical protein CsSME_00040623 [Camellia sinensis var. sinensis]
MVGSKDGVVNQGSTLCAGVWTPVEEKSKCNSAGTGNTAATTNNSNIKHVLDRPGNDVVDRVIDFVNIEEPNITSLVRRDYEYPGLVKRCKQSKDEVNIEDDEGGCKTWAGFGMKNRYPVWKLLVEDEQKLLQVVYTFEGDGAVVWSAAEYGVRVNFKDIQSLVQGGPTAGNVIDAYAEILKSSQNVAVVNCANFSKSYFHSSLCSDMMKNRCIMSKDSYLNMHVTAASGCRYVHYPIYDANHWTTLVVDYTKRAAGKLSSIVGVTSENIDGPLEALGDFPQQHSESPNCAIMVCFIMRQYANNVEVEGSMDGMAASAFRAEMIKAFINDPHRGLRN